MAECVGEAKMNSLWSLPSRSSAYWDKIRWVNKELFYKRECELGKKKSFGSRGCLVESQVGFGGGEVVERTKPSP